MDGQDSSFASSQYGTSVMPALPSGKISFVGTNGSDNSIGYDGYVYNWPVALYTVRFRHYSPVHGRWLERDPLWYIDSLNLSEYVMSSPYVYIDSSGAGIFERFFRWSYSCYNPRYTQHLQPDGTILIHIYNEDGSYRKPMIIGNGDNYSRDVDWQAVEDELRRRDLDEFGNATADGIKCGIIIASIAIPGPEDVACTAVLALLKCGGKWYKVTKAGERIAASADEIAAGERAISNSGKGARVLKCTDKIENQIPKRGWCEEDMIDVYNNPNSTKPGVDRISGGAPATHYIDENGNYITVNDETCEVIQVSNKNDPGWKPEWDK